MITVINDHLSLPNMDFCPRCGRYLKDGEYQCRECGNIVRQPPMEEMPEQIFISERQPVDLKKMVFERYFFIALIIGFAATFAITMYWRFTFLFFCIPLLFPMGRISIGAGLLGGMMLGSGTALLVKYLMANGIL